MNELLFIAEVILSFSGVLLAHKFFGKYGLFAWIAMNTIIANIEVVKCVDMFSMPMTLGNITFGSVFLATDIINEKYGRKVAQKGVFIGFFSLMTLTIFTQLDLLYVPNSEDFVQQSMQTLFAITPRLCFGSMFAYLISHTTEVFLFSTIRKFLPDDKFLWVRNNVATITSQLLDTILFTFIAFLGVFPFKTVVTLCLTTYLIKVVLAFCETPFLYAAKRINND